MTPARLALAAIAIAAFASCGNDDPADPTTEAKTIPVTIGTTVVHVELAVTYAERSKGLMGRTSLPDTAGMLFVYGGDQFLDFWMKDTPVALSIAFLDANGVILNIEDMAPNTLDTHRSAAPARYALEVRQGWFAARNLSVGAKAVFTLPVGLAIDP